MRASSIMQAFFVSVGLVFILFCVFWATVYSRYMQYYGIQEFFNPFFVNVFDKFAYGILVVIFGIGFAIPFLEKLFKVVIFALLACATLLFIPSLGKSVGEICLARDYRIMVDGAEKVVHGLYENPNYIVYLTEDSSDFETRKRNLVYYQKPTEE